MCGIFAVIGQQSKQSSQDNALTRLYEDFMSMKHRGPDHSTFQVLPHLIIGFHRLAIVDPTMRSNQPFLYETDDRTVLFLCNGEIYNYKEIVKERGLARGANDYNSDCRVIPEAYLQIQQNKEHAVHTFERFIQREVKGEFAFILIELDALKNLTRVIVGRDSVGVRPLFVNKPSDSDSVLQELYLTSELKGALHSTHEFQEFPPGHLYVYTATLEGLHLQKLNYTLFYSVRPAISHTYSANKPIWDECELSDGEHLLSIRDAVTNSVKRRLNADQPLAWLLSGGVDSSLVAAISARLLGKRIRTFCCGMAGGTDLVYARQVAEHIGSDHTEVLFTAEEALAAIPDVIKTIESWDTTTVRASVGQYLVSKHIGTRTDCKVVLVGEGPDEVCSSYLFNWYAPSGAAIDACARESVKNIHHYDVKRADRCMARWGLEGRVPLLDPEFIESYWVIPGEERHPRERGLEKWWLREAFAGTGLLPDEVLYRKKEAFSDGISQSAKGAPRELKEDASGLKEDASGLKEDASGLKDDHDAAPREPKDDHNAAPREPKDDHAAAPREPKDDHDAAPRERGQGGHVVSPSWFEIIQAWVEDKVTDEELSMAATTYPHCPPTTKEAYYYRRLFCESVGANRQTIIPAYWQPKWSADGKEVTGYVDPSARTLEVYSE
jgi:asparagine synthase (glutamine-hydrolysing)